MKKIILMFYFLIISVSLFSVSVKAKTEKISNGTSSIGIDLIDPVSYNKTGIVLENVVGKTVLYTSEWNYETTKRDEDVVEFVVTIIDDKHIISNKSLNGNTFIPLNGYVISIPKSNNDNKLLNIDDVLTGNILKQIQTHKSAIIGLNGVRTAITEINKHTGVNGISLYDSDFGKKTNTGKVFIEMIAEYDINSMSYKVKDFKEPMDGTDEGSEIPENGFVISTRKIKTMMQLIKGNKYNIGDELKVVGLNNIENDNEIYKHKYITINPNAKTNPNGVGSSGFRSENQMLVYDHNWEGKTVDGFTGTNVHGFEVGVSSEGYIIETNINVKIPENGFVISGHGTEALFLRNTLKIGGLVKFDLDTNEMIITYSFFDTRLVSVQIILENSKDIIEESKKMMYDNDLSEAENRYNLAQEKHLEMKKTSNSIENVTVESEKDKLTNHFRILSNEAEKLLEDIVYLTMPRQNVEARAVWHHPREQTLEEMIKTLDALENININMVFLSSHWQGYSIFKSDIIDHHPTVSKFRSEEYNDDYLTAFLAEARKRGMEVHSWNLVFHSGTNLEVNNVPLSNVLKDNPEFHMVNFDGTITQNTIYMLDPANPKVHKLLIDYYQELHSKYDFDGFHYDYIRYRPITMSSNPDEIIDGGYTEYAMNAFKNEYGYTEDLRKLILDNPRIYMEWSNWRREELNKLVGKISNSVREVDKDIQISMATVSDPVFARNTYLQDWGQWIENGWIDIISPMIYHPSEEYVGNSVKKIQEKTKNLTYQYAGIGAVYHDYPILNNQLQIIASNENGAFGTAIFDSVNILNNEEFMRILKISSNKNKALLPHDRTRAVVYSTFDDILRKSEEIYIKNGAMTSEQKEKLTLQINMLKEYPTRNASEINKLINQLEITYHYIDTYASGEAINRIKEDIDRLMRILDIKISRDLITRKLWDPEFLKDRPNVDSFEYPLEPEEPTWPDMETENPGIDEVAPKSGNVWLYVSIGIVSFIVIATISTFIIYKNKQKKKL